MIKKTTKLNQYFKLEPYPYNLIFVDNLKDLKKQCDLLNIYCDKTDVGGLCVSDTATHNFIVLLLHRNTQTLVHEISHVAIDLFDFIGHDILPNASEPFCYLVDDLYKKGCEAYGFKTTVVRPKKKIIKKGVPNE